MNKTRHNIHNNNTHTYGYLRFLSITEVNFLLDLGNHTSHHCHERDVGNTAYELSTVSEAAIEDSRDLTNTCQTLHAVVKSNETDITRICRDVVMILHHELRRGHGESGAAKSLDAQATYVSLTTISDRVVTAWRISLTALVLLGPVLTVNMLQCCLSNVALRTRNAKRSEQTAERIRAASVLHRCIPLVLTSLVHGIVLIVRTHRTVIKTQETAHLFCVCTL